MSAESVITGIITSSQAIADEMADEAKDLANQASVVINGFVNPSLEINDFEPWEIAYDRTEHPALNPAFWNVTKAIPGAPGLAQAQSEIDVDDSDLPDAPDLASDNLDEIDPPKGGVKTWTGKPPSINTSVRSIALPNLKSFAPLSLIDVDIPDRTVEAALPPFTAQRPAFQGGALPDLVPLFEQSFREQMSALRAEAKTLGDSFVAKFFPRFAESVSALDDHMIQIMSGGKTAWSNTTQRDIYNLRRDQTEGERLRLVESRGRAFARAGVVSDLAHSVAAVRIEQAAHDANVLAAYQTTEQRAERETRHLELVMAQLGQMRSVAVNAFLAYQNLLIAQNQQALAYAGAVTDAAVQAYNLAVVKFNADISLYSAEANVYTARVRAAFIEMELLREELEVARVQTEVNRARVAQLEAEIGAEQQKIDLYTAQVRGLAAELELRRLPLELFRANIESHRVYLEGKQTETDLYRALVQGQSEITDQDLARVSLYREQTAAWRARVDALRAKYAHGFDYNRDVRETQSLDLDKLRAEIANVDGRERLRLSRDNLRVDAWGQTERLKLQDAERQARDQQVQAQLINELSRIAADYTIQVMRTHLERFRSIAEVNNNAAATLADIGTGALAANGSAVQLINSTETQL